ncbi:MAG TPA: hypothetical protein VFL13_13765 [Candidatus Baltobacteraceae bacterium]|nr:hypothetical protein [Candidatus Baltobacteraceae bacterium]
MVTRLRSVNPVQAGIMYGAITAVVVFIIMLLMLPFSAAMATMGNAGKVFGFGFGIAALIVGPIMYFIVGFIGGVITAALYNLVAGWTGGVEITLTTPVETPAAPASTQGYTV